jgi:hypothetical protein
MLAPTLIIPLPVQQRWLPPPNAVKYLYLCKRKRFTFKRSSRDTRLAPGPPQNTLLKL